MFRAWLIPSIIPCELWRLKVLPTKAWSFQRQARNEENPSLKILKTTALKISISVLQAISFQIIFFSHSEVMRFCFVMFLKYILNNKIHRDSAIRSRTTTLQMKYQATMAKATVTLFMAIFPSQDCQNCFLLS